MKLGALIKQSGWRRLAFMGGCLSIAAGAAYFHFIDPAGSGQIFSGALLPVTALFVVLCAAAPWLIQSHALPALTDTTDPYASKSNQQRFVLAAILAMIIAGTVWSKRINSSLWTDEMASVRANIVGRWKHQDNDHGKLIRPTLADTLLDYKTPNNHTLYSLAARLSHEWFAGINDTDFSRPYFSEWALRLPAFIAALLTLPLVGYLALRLGSLSAAMLAMAWAVMHPWFLEFSTSVRGYSFAMLFLSVAVLAAVNLFRNGGGWRWWILYGLGQLLAFLSIATVAHFLVMLNTAVLLGLLFDRSVMRNSRRPHFFAFLTTNLVALGFAALYFIPKLDPLHDYLNSGLFRANLQWSWLADCISNLLTGQPYHCWDASNPLVCSTDQWPMVVLIGALILALTVTVLSLVRHFDRGVFAWSLAVAILLPPLTVFLHGRLTHFYMFPWYAVWQLPLWIALLSTGATKLVPAIIQNRKPWISVAIPCVIGIALLAATKDPFSTYRDFAYEPMRESAALIRKSSNPYAPGHDQVITTSIVSANHAYDPWNRRIHSAADLRKQIALADEEGKPLYCSTAWLEFVKEKLPECYFLLTDSHYFEPVGTPLYALQINATRHTFRYKPNSMRQWDPSIEHRSVSTFK